MTDVCGGPSSVTSRRPDSQPWGFPVQERESKADRTRGFRTIVMYEKQSKIIWFFLSHGDKYIVLDISWTPHHFGEIKERTLDEALFKFKLFLQIPLLPRSLSHCGL